MNIFVYISIKWYGFTYTGRRLSTCPLRFLCRLQFRALETIFLFSLFFFFVVVKEFTQQIASNNLCGLTRPVHKKQKVVLLNQAWVNCIDKQRPGRNYFPITFWLVCGCLQFVIYLLRKSGFFSGSLPDNICLSNVSGIQRSQMKNGFCFDWWNH